MSSEAKCGARYAYPGRMAYQCDREAGHGGDHRGGNAHAVAAWDDRSPYALPALKEGVTLAQRLRALAKDRGKTSPTAAQELERMAEEVAALEELKEAPPAERVVMVHDSQVIPVDRLKAALQELADQDSVESTGSCASFIWRRMFGEVMP